MPAASVEWSRQGLSRGPQLQAHTGLWPAPRRPHRGPGEAPRQSGEACARPGDESTAVMDASATPKLYKTLPGPLRKEEKKRSEDHHTHRVIVDLLPLKASTYT